MGPFCNIGQKGLIPWPQWDLKKPRAVIFQNSTLFLLVIIDDNYLTNPLNYVMNVSLIYPLTEETVGINFL